MSARFLAIVSAVAMLFAGSPPPAASQAAAVGQTAAGGQAAADTEAADTQAAEAIAAMAKAVENRDAPAVRAQLQVYEELWRRVSPKMLKKVITSVVAMFKGFKPREDYDLPLEPVLPGDEPRVVEDTGKQELLDAYRLAAGVLYDKPEGREIIQTILKIPHVRQWPEVVALLVEGLGYQPDTGLTAVIKPYLDDPSALICGAAAKALAQLHDEPIAVRREAVAALVKAYSAAQEAADKERRRSKPQDDEGGAETQPMPAAERLALMDVPFEMSLQKLTRQSFPDPKGWQEWFDQHGKDATW
jgi:hypothetical protein